MMPLTEFDAPGTGHPSNNALTVRVLIGEAIGAHSDDIAGLRVAVLRDWPYLYNGNAGSDAAGYETGYLQTCVGSWRSVAVLVFDGDRVVGASTGLPLADATDATQAPFTDAGIDVRRVFLCGDSMLLPAYRGRGLGHRFFDERESHARILGDFELTAFCTVDRACDDPRRPPFGRSNEPFWRKRGYRPPEGLKTSLRWNEVGAGEVQHTLAVWLRQLERSR